MTFAIWHVLAISTLIGLSFFAGYNFAKQKLTKTIKEYNYEN
jgi:hypothetical protein